MNKRTMFMIGVVSAALLTSAGAVNATPTKNTIYVDGTKVNGAAYMINNNNSDYLQKARKYGHFTGYKN